jgi:hypothetical protein
MFNLLLLPPSLSRYQSCTMALLSAEHDSHCRLCLILLLSGELTFDICEHSCFSLFEEEESA